MSGMTVLTNAMTVDVEDYFQVQAFAGCVGRSDWDGFPGRVEAQHQPHPGHVRRRRGEGHVLHAGLGGAPVSRHRPPHGA